jgi:cadmium resistance transport/sequestration family protein
MRDMELILTSIIAFTTTNIDDIFILTVFYGNKNFKSQEIIIGQYLGIVTLISISVTGSFIGLIIDSQYIGLLGFAPIYIGIKALVNLENSKEEEPELQVASPYSKNRMQNIMSVASATIANGADNISIYIPLFATLVLSGKMVMIAVFLGMTLLWCLIARYLGNHPLLEKAFEKYSHLITPFVFILLGFYILYDSKTFQLLDFLF